METTSIYDLIRNSTAPDGRLPKDFSLPAYNTDPKQLRFVPGARDGIGIFHTDRADPDITAKEIEIILRNTWKNKKLSFTSNLFTKDNIPNSTSRISALLQENSAMAVVDTILGSIRNDHAEIIVEKMVADACRFAFQSNEEELVKLGIALLGLTDLTDKSDIIDKLFTLALFDEFTLYVTVAFSGCQNGNALMFQIAQKVEGWGKIHVVERLEPQTDEIKNWLLRKGCRNEIMDSYLGLVCAEKGDLISALRSGAIDDELYEGIAVIIGALLGEGPVDGISVYEHAGEALQLYLDLAGTHAVSIKHLWYLLNLQSWLEDSELANKEELLKCCNCIVGKPAWLEMIDSIMDYPDDSNFFYAENAARQLGHDVTEKILSAIKAAPIKHYGYLPVLYINSNYAKELTGLYEQVLPLTKMQTGMGDDLFPASLYQEHNCLDFILQEIQYYPNMGEAIVKTGLLSSVNGTRNASIRALEEWTHLCHKPLCELSPTLFAVVSNVAPIEIDMEKQERMNKLLAGVIPISHA